MFWLFPFIQGHPDAAGVLLLLQRKGCLLSSSLLPLTRHVSCPGLTDPCRWRRRTTDGTGHRVVRCRCRMSASAAGARVGTDVSSMDQNRFWQVEAPGAAHASDTSSGPATASRCDSGTDLLSRVVRFISLPLNPEPAKREIRSERKRSALEPPEGGNGGSHSETSEIHAGAPCLSCTLRKMIYLYEKRLL